jgi:hypothetical protein
VDGLSGPTDKPQFACSIKQHDVLKTCSKQQTYRLGIDERLDNELRPQYLSVHVLKCISFKHPNVVRGRLTDKGFGWMLETDVNFKRKSPASRVLVSYIALELGLSTQASISAQVAGYSPGRMFSCLTVILLTSEYTV